ncbi:hypothetical protein DIJ62_30675, partial [Burkholderia pseudomallei]
MARCPRGLAPFFLPLGAHRRRRRPAGRAGCAGRGGQGGAGGGGRRGRTPGGGEGGRRARRGERGGALGGRRARGHVAHGRERIRGRAVVVEKARERELRVGVVGRAREQRRERRARGVV